MEVIINYAITKQNEENTLWRCENSWMSVILVLQEGK